MNSKLKVSLRHLKGKQWEIGIHNTKTGSSVHFSREVQDAHQKAVEISIVLGNSGTVWEADDLNRILI